jgi:hypothetical protein
VTIAESIVHVQACVQDLKLVALKIPKHERPALGIKGGATPAIGERKTGIERKGRLRMSLHEFHAQQKVEIREPRRLTPRSSAMHVDTQNDVAAYAILGPFRTFYPDAVPPTTPVSAATFQRDVLGSVPT